jgi:hypothetical protein
MEANLEREKNRCPTFDNQTDTVEVRTVSQSTPRKRAIVQLISGDAQSPRSSASSTTVLDLNFADTKLTTRKIAVDHSVEENEMYQLLLSKIKQQEKEIADLRQDLVKQSSAIKELNSTLSSIVRESRVGSVESTKSAATSLENPASSVLMSSSHAADDDGFLLRAVLKNSTSEPEFAGGDSNVHENLVQEIKTPSRVCMKGKLNIDVHRCTHAEPYRLNLLINHYIPQPGRQCHRFARVGATGYARFENDTE